MSDMVKKFRSSPISAPLRFVKSFRKKSENASSSIKKYCPASTSKKLLADVIWAETRYRISFDEYFILNFEKLSHKGRTAFIGELEKNSIADKFNKDELSHFFDNKDETYSKYKEFYKRNLIKINSKEDYALFSEFAEKQSEFIVKPISAACGSGVEKVRSTDYNGIEEMFFRLCEKYKNEFIAEDLIVQSEFTGSFHPASVNTVRITTVRLKESVKVCHPFIRIGKGNSSIDNVSSGGIMGLIDTETGIITDTYSDGGRKYIFHPDTGVQILGVKIPRWDEAVEMAKNLAAVLPDNRYTGWDLALTDKGWIMVEANRRAQMVYQYPAGNGCRKEYLKYLNC